MADPTKPGPNDTSAAYRAMSADWQKIADIRAGADAVRAKGTTYLPRFEAEGQEDYDRRRQQAPWRPEFNDALASLVAKPFAQDVGVNGTEDAETKAFVEDVDTRGNSLTVFARETFADGVANGVHGILVDHTPNTGARTVSEERAAGARPYFVQVNALDLIAVYFGIVNGKLVPVYARMREEVVERQGFGEVCIKQVRELEPGIWRTYRENDKKEWVQHEEGVTSLKIVPLVLFFTGERKGDYRVKPPLKDLADLQIELYQALSRQDEVLNFCGFPMLSGNGFAQPKDPIKVGPRSILFAPAADGVNTSWTFIQPDAANIKEVRDHIGTITADMRRLAITFPRAFPDNIKWVKTQPKLVRALAQNRLSNGAFQSTEVIDPLWSWDFETAPLLPGDRWEMEAWALSLQEGQNTFYAFDVSNKYPRAYGPAAASLTKAEGGAWTGTGNIEIRTASTLTLSELPANYQAKAGDALSFVRNGARSYHRIIESVTGSSGGVVTVTVEPSLRSPLPIQDTDVTLIAAPIVLRMVPGSWENPGIQGRQSITFQAVQDLI